MIQPIIDVFLSSGFAALTVKHIIMISIVCVLLYLAIKKGYEPYLLVPIAFGMLLVNLPLTGLMEKGVDGQPGGLIYYIYKGTELGIYPPLIFLCLGSTIDFAPLIANPKTLFLGGAAQIGIFIAFLGALLLGFTPQEAAAIGITGGADGPTAIYLTTQLASQLLPAIVISAYSYMALIPIIQPPVINMLTTKEERMIKMEQLRPVSKKEKIIFPIITTIFVILVLPQSAPLVGMLMLGNLIRECGRVPKIADVLQNSLMYIVTILLGITVGAKAEAEIFLTVETLKIIFLGLVAFTAATVCGVLMGKIMCKLSGGKINPMIGAAGVSAVPMAARVVQAEGVKNNPSNFLLMHAMGPNVAGVIGSAVAAGVLLRFFGG